LYIIELKIETNILMRKLNDFFSEKIKDSLV